MLPPPETASLPHQTANNTLLHPCLKMVLALGSEALLSGKETDPSRCKGIKVPEAGVYHPCSLLLAIKLDLPISESQLAGGRSREWALTPPGMPGLETIREVI